jgi:chromosome segregation ATPase
LWYLLFRGYMATAHWLCKTQSHHPYFSLHISIKQEDPVAAWMAKMKNLLARPEMTSAQLRIMFGEGSKQPLQQGRAGSEASVTSSAKLQRRAADVDAKTDLIECGLHVVQDDVSELQRSVKQAVVRVKAVETALTAAAGANTQLQRELVAAATLKQTVANNNAAVARLEASIAQLQQAPSTTLNDATDASDDAQQTAQLAVTTAMEALESSADASSRADDALYTADAAAASATAASTKMDEAYVLLYHLDQQYALVLAEQKLLQLQCAQLQQQQQQVAPATAATSSTITQQRVTADASTNTECIVPVSAKTCCCCSKTSQYVHVHA